jgi:hypothetical protein
LLIACDGIAPGCACDLSVPSFTAPFRTFDGIE